MARWCVCLAVAAALAAAAGCQRDEDKRERGSERRRRSVEVHKPPPPVRVLDEIVVSRGDGPHRLLRYRRSGRHRHSRAATAEVSEIENRKKRPALELPRVTTRFALAWRGAGVLEIDIAAPEIAGGADREASDYAEVQTARFRSLLAGKAASVVLSDRGVLGDVGGLAGSNEARRELAAALVDSIVVLPEVPVGPGARWRVIRAVPRARTSVKQRATYTLKSIDGDRLVIAVELLTIGERQPVALTGPSPGTTSELLALRVWQTGELTVDLGAPTAVAGSLERSDTIHLRTTRRQKTLHDYFAQSRSRIELATR